MKALVLAGGTGTRLRPLTHTASKQLVPIANKPILFYGLESIAASGISDVIVVVGDTGAEVRQAVGDGSRFGLKVTYVAQDAPRGLAHAVKVAAPLLGEEDFVMYLGDNFLTGGITEIVEHFRHRGPDVAAEIMLAHVPDPTRFGVAELDSEGGVLRLVEKPQNPPSDLALVGVYLFDKSIHAAVASIEPSPRGELEITDAIDALIAMGFSVSATMVEGFWKDLGEPEALLEGNRMALAVIVASNEGEVKDSFIEGPVVIQAGARIVRSRVRGPAVIGADSVITDSFVGPYSSIGSGCELTSTEIQNSIVLDNTVIDDISGLEGSVVGRSVRITRRRDRPLVSRVVVGDHSRVEFL